MTYLDRSITNLDSPCSTHAEDLAAGTQALTTATYDNLITRLDQPTDSFWCHMRPTERPSYTHALMRDLAAMRRDIDDAFTGMPGRDGSAFKWFVMASATPGIFNLGGDLSLFAKCIEAGEHAALRHYGRVAIDNIYQNSIGFGLPVITIALIQGDALGGGFEHALSSDLIVAERSAKLGLPEILFNLFPGMGAYSFLSRRIGQAQAEALIMSGRVHTAQEMHSMGVIDLLAEDGQGEATVRDYIARHGRKHNAHHAIYRARRRANPVTLQELQDIVDIWAETAMNLTQADLRKMTRLASAQNRRLAPAAGIEKRSVA